MPPVTKPTTTSGGGGGSSGSGASGLINELESSQDPTLAGYGLQLAGIQGQLDQVLPDANLANQYATTMAGYQGAQQGISNQQLGLQSAGLGFQQQNQAAQQGIEEQQYGLSQTQFPEQEAQLANQYQNSMQNFSGSVATSGAQHSGGQAQQQQNINLQTNWGQQDISRAQGQAALGQQGEELGYGLSQQQNALSAQNLQLMAQANGLSEAQTKDQLNYGIQQTNQAAVNSADQYLGQMGNVLTGEVSTVGAAAAPAAYAGSVNPYAPGATP